MIAGRMSPFRGGHRISASVRHRKRCGTRPAVAGAAAAAVAGSRCRGGLKHPGNPACR